MGQDKVIASVVYVARERNN